MSITRPRKNWRYVIAIIAMPCVIAAWILFTGAEAEKDAIPSSTNVEVIADDIEEVVTAQGKLEPKNYVDVGAQVSGPAQDRTGYHW